MKQMTCDINICINKTASAFKQYSLRWETKYLMELGEAFDYILNGAISMATQEHSNTPSFLV